MATQIPLKIASGKRKRFVSGDTVGVNNGGTNLSTIAANSLLGATTLDTFSAIALPLATNYGGLGVDLSATGAATYVLAQNSAHVISARALIAADIPSLDASIITSGTIATARLGSGTADSTTYLRGDNTWATVSSGASLSTITAGTLSASVPLNLGTNAIVFNGIGSVPASTVSYIVGDAANGNVILNVATGKSITNKVAGTAYLTVDASAVTLGTTLALGSQVITSTGSPTWYTATGQSIRAGVSSVPLLALGTSVGTQADGSWALGAFATGAVDYTKAGLEWDGTTLAHNAPTGKRLGIICNSAYQFMIGSSNGVQSDTSFALGAFGTSTYDYTKPGIAWEGTNLQYNAPASKSHRFVQNSAFIATFGYSAGSQGDGKFAMGLFGCGAYDGTKAGLAWDTAALRSNVPTGTFEQHKVAGSDLFLLGHANNVQGDTRWAIGGYGTGAYDNTKAGIAYDAAALLCNVPTGKYALIANAGTNYGLSVGCANGVVSDTYFALGAFGASTYNNAKPGIAWDSNYMAYNVPTGKYHLMTVAGTNYGLALGAANGSINDASFALGGFGASTYTGTKAGIASTGATSLDSNVATGGSITQRVNNATKLAINTNVEIGTAALATSATAGFLNIPTCAGTPTGAPSPTTGLGPIVVDTANKQFDTYFGSTWHSIAFADGPQKATNFATKTTTYTATASDYIIFGNHATIAFTITLPAATATGQILIIKNINAAVVTVAGNGAELIDASNTQALTLNTSITIIDHATGQWRII